MSEWDHLSVRHIIQACQQAQVKFPSDNTMEKRLRYVIKERKKWLKANPNPKLALPDDKS